jgi:hypothetical protein
MELKQQLVAVEYPGYVKNEDKAVASLGGEQGIQKVRAVAVAQGFEQSTAFFETGAQRQCSLPDCASAATRQLFASFTW